MANIEFDFSELRGLIRAKGKTEGEIAAECGIATNTFSRKINGEGFKPSEIVFIAKTLGITGNKLGKYFFATKV